MLWTYDLSNPASEMAKTLIFSCIRTSLAEKKEDFYKLSIA